MTVPDLRAIVVIDYQNVHLTAHELFSVSRHLPRHESLIDPLHFANQLIMARNSAQRPGHPRAVLTRVLVYRGQPSAVHDPKPYARNQAQKAHWERDGRVSVTHRQLMYRYERDASGELLLDGNGQRIVESKSDNGIDVLCALAMVREAQRPDVDLVILASHDSDLQPSLDEAISLGSAKIETFCWVAAASSRRWSFDLEHPSRRDGVPELLGPYKVRVADPCLARAAETSSRRVWIRGVGEPIASSRSPVAADPRGSRSLRGAIRGAN